jgi:hypothetical protein
MLKQCANYIFEKQRIYLNIHVKHLFNLERGTTVNPIPPGGELR